MNKLNLVRNVFIRRFSAVKFPGCKVLVNEIDIHYEKVGSGPNTLLLLPGVLGTTTTDFLPQLNNLDPKLFTMIAWDPPGYGYSRPPNRSFTTDFYDKDAHLAAALMRMLNYEKYSILGWSDGAISALIMAAHYPKEIIKLISLAGCAFINQKDISYIEAIRDVSLWSEKMKTPLIEIYGEEYFKATWNNFCEILMEIGRNNEGNICREKLAKIECETLIVQGDKDPLVDSIHPDYLKDNIKNARIVKFKNGKHNLHLRYHEEFNKLVTDFILS